MDEGCRRQWNQISGFRPGQPGALLRCLFLSSLTSSLLMDQHVWSFYLLWD